MQEGEEMYEWMLAAYSIEILGNYSVTCRDSIWSHLPWKTGQDSLFITQHNCRAGSVSEVGEIAEIPTVRGRYFGRLLETTGLGEAFFERQCVWKEISNFLWIMCSSCVLWTTNFQIMSLRGSYLCCLGFIPGGKVTPLLAQQWLTISRPVWLTCIMINDILKLSSSPEASLVRNSVILRDKHEKNAIPWIGAI